ncbi:MAG TPA: ABC transporter permease, partial [Sphingomonas sp.]|nr:ABC transporter permease [Sphingomonas sp.]
MRRFLAQALVVARRDFIAIVFTPTFLIFLLAPLFMLSVATIGGLGAARVVADDHERVVVLTGASKADRFRAAEERLRLVSGTDPGPPGISYEAATNDPHGQALRLLARGEAAAVLFDAGRAPTVLYKPDRARDAAYLALAARAAASGIEPQLQSATPPRPQTGARERTAAGFGAVFAMFFLSLLLASQAISMLAEERSNKVVEILAAAIPIEAMFFGKLIGMLGVALVFIAFWGGILGLAASAGLGGLSLGTIAPAGGLAGFAVLFILYFMLAFLLLGAVFLGVGAQAASMREIQMMSLPITIFQVSMFALASAGAGDPDGPVGVTAALFPFSSPFAMAARAANNAPAWQHVAALAWQSVWVAVTVAIAARLFRRGVLKSGVG